MLRGNWRYIVAFGLALVVPLGIVGLIYREAAILETFYQHQADEGAQAARNGGAIHAQRACALVPLTERAECQADEINAARERERQERDLQAQLVTSAWTRAMGLAALAATMISMIGVGLVYTTFRETRRAAESASKTYQAFVRVEDASLIVEFPTGTKVESSVEGVKQPAAYFLTPVITNVGRSTARIQGWSVNDGEFQRQEHTLKAGESWTIQNKIHFASQDGSFKMSVYYSSPLAEGRILDVAAQATEKRGANGGSYYPAHVKSASVRNA